MNLFAKSAAGLNLTPGERAFLKLCEGFLMAGLVAAMPIVAQALGQHSVSWSIVIQTAAGAFVVAALLAASKYYKAAGDAPLATVLSAAADGLNEAKVPLVHPALSSAPVTTAPQSPAPAQA